MKPEAIISQISLEDNDLVINDFENSLDASVNLSLVFSGNMSIYVNKKKKLKKKKFLMDLINGELPINGIKNVNRQNITSNCKCSNKDLDFEIVRSILSKYGTVAVRQDVILNQFYNNVTTKFQLEEIIKDN
tara:strand:- start:735 stop:1130 length:396 start_codon:yes stop_codon:yes gene_type:complete